MYILYLSRNNSMANDHFISVLQGHSEAKKNLVALSVTPGSQTSFPSHGIVSLLWQKETTSLQFSPIG